MKLANFLLKNEIDTWRDVLYRISIPIIWFSLLINTSSYLSIYFYIVVFYLYFVFTKKKIDLTNKETKITCVFAFVFSIFVALTNYDIYNNVYYPITKILGMILIFVSGSLLFYYVLSAIFYSICKGNEIKLNKNDGRKVFIYTFFILLFIYLLFYCLIAFPGYISEDGINQISQIETGIYDNHHPIWHTYLIKVFYRIGNLIFSNNIYAIAFFIIFQIVLFALIVSFANNTLCQLGANRIANIVFCAYYALMPFNIIYSFTLLKDVTFSLLFLLLITCYIRVNQHIGNETINIILLLMSIICVGLFRTNGKFILILLLFFTIVFFRTERVMLFSLTAGLVVVFSLNYYSSNILEIPNADTVESLSIPIQQVSRVICDNNDLTEIETDLLKKIVDVDSISNIYNPGLSDPIKKLIREKGDQKYLTDHIEEYASLYIKIGLRHPIKFIDAWIDQTKGYINGGYDESIYYMMIVDNDYSIYSSYLSKPIYKLFRCYNELFSKNTLQIFTSIGVQTWIAIVILYLGLLLKNNRIIYISLLPLFLVGTLLIATPVAIEFRYSYPLFITNILISIYSFYIIKKSNN